MALAEDNKPRFATVPNVDSGKIADSLSANVFGQSTNTVVCFTAGLQGALVDSIEVVSTDTAAKIVHLYLYKGSGDPVPLGAYTIPLGAGSNGTALPIDLLSNALASYASINNQGKRQHRLEANWTILAGVVAPVTASKNIWVNVSGLDFEA